MVRATRSSTKKSTLASKGKEVAAKKKATVAKKKVEKKIVEKVAEDEAPPASGSDKTVTIEACKS